MDESGFDLNMQKEYGYAQKSERLLADRSGKRGERVSVMGTRNYKHELICPFYFKGYTNKAAFKTYLRVFLLPNLPKNSYLVMDNASFHKGKDIEELIRSYKIRPLYLPPYSPDLNPIEKKWAQIKAVFRKFVYCYEDKMKLLDDVLTGALMST
jgi:transposase